MLPGEDLGTHQSFTAAPRIDRLRLENVCTAASASLTSEVKHVCPPGITDLQLVVVAVLVLVYLYGYWLSNKSTETDVTRAASLAGCVFAVGPAKTKLRYEFFQKSAVLTKHWGISAHLLLHHCRVYLCQSCLNCTSVFLQYSNCSLR